MVTQLLLAATLQGIFVPDLRPYTGNSIPEPVEIDGDPATLEFLYVTEEDGYRILNARTLCSESPTSRITATLRFRTYTVKDNRLWWIEFGWDASTGALPYATYPAEFTACR